MAERAKSISEAANAAEELYRDKENSRFWPGPLVRRLEHSKPKLALMWAIRLFQEMALVQRKTVLNSKQLRWLTELESLIECDGIADQCDKSAYAIWNNDPVMNSLERGIARLYWALQNHQLGLMEPDYYLQVGAAVAMLGDYSKSAGDPDEPTFEYGISLFHRLLADKIFTQ